MKRLRSCPNFPLHLNNSTRCWSSSSISLPDFLILCTSLTKIHACVYIVSPRTVYYLSRYIERGHWLSIALTNPFTINFALADCAIFIRSTFRKRWIVDSLPIRITLEIIEKVENENRGKVSNKYRVALKKFKQRFKIYR